MSYYSRWATVIGTTYFQRFLRANYALGLSDLKQFGRDRSFEVKNFTCLLCGVGNEKTAATFIEFVTERNPQARIYIIDLGTEQIDAVKKLVVEKYSHLDVTIRQMNALDLPSFLKVGSVNWIETDGFLEFFSPKQLQQLLNIWHKLLKAEGFVTIREPASSTFLGEMLDQARVTGGKMWLGVVIYIHTLSSLSAQFTRGGFDFVSAATAVPTFRRFTLVKK